MRDQLAPSAGLRVTRVIKGGWPNRVDRVDDPEGIDWDVDHVVLCAGQDPLRELVEPLEAEGVTVHLVGGAEKAAELDAKRAINKAARLAAVI